MTIIAVANDLATVAGLRQMELLFGSQDRTAAELRALASEAAAMLANSKDWRALARQATIPDGTPNFPLPADFDRFRQDTRLTTEAGAVLGQITTDVPVYFPVGGAWSFEGGEIVLRDVVGPVTFAYQSRMIVRADDGTEKPEFTADDDTFVLPERLLKLCMIWRWKANKGLPFDVDFQVYERELGREAAHDGPREVLALGKTRYFKHVKLAWPGVVG